MGRTDRRVAVADGQAEAHGSGRAVGLPTVCLLGACWVPTVCPLAGWVFVQVRAGAADESACTPGSVTVTPCGIVAAGDHPSRPAVAGRLMRSTRRLGRAALERLRRPAAWATDPS